jgi:hypothetical protein
MVNIVTKTSRAACRVAPASGRKKRAIVLYTAECTFCGQVVIRADESSLQVAGRRKTWGCTFRCPVCRRDTRSDVPVSAGHVLVASGARVTHEPVPCEPPPPGADRKLQLDDLIDFHTLLSGDAWFDRLVQSVPNA